MKKPVQTLVALLAFGAVTLAAQAQPALKILVVDMAKLYDNHYKTIENNAKIQSEDAKASEEVDRMNKAGNALVEEFRTLEEQTNNPVLTAEAKAKAQDAAAKKYAAIQAKQEEVNQFIQNTRQTLGQRFQNFKNMMLEEITATVADMGKRKGATLIIDKAGPTYFGISNFIYADPAYDFTDEVLKELNKNAPAGAATTAPATPAPAAGSLAAPPATPATGTAPSINIPGMNK